MNNSKIAIDKVSLSLEEPISNLEALQEKEAYLMRIIDAINTIIQSTEWSTLKSLIFEPALSTLEKRLRNESEKLELNVALIHQLQGQIIQAGKYDLEKQVISFKQELANIRKITQPTER